MKLHHLRVWVLLAAVLMGQWLSVAHASQHPALEPVADLLCDYCVSGIGAGSVPALPPALPLLAANTQALRLPVIIAVRAQGKQPPRNRGPPQNS